MGDSVILLARLVRNLRATVQTVRSLLDDVAQLADAEIMLGGDRQRVAEPEGKRLVDAGFRSAALAFIGGEDHGLAR